MKSIRKLLRYTKPYKSFMMLAPLLMALEVTMDLLQPFMMQKIIDSGIANGDMTYVVQMGMLMAGAAVIGLAGGAGCTIYSTRASVNTATDIRRDVYKKAGQFSSENRDVIGTGKLLTIVTSDISLLQTAIMMTLRSFVRGPLLFIGSSVIVFFQAPELFPILLVLIPILLFLIIFLSRKAGSWFRKVQEGIDQLNTKLQESITGIRVVKAFVRRDYEIGLFQKVNDSLTKTTITAEQIITILMPVSMFVINIGVVISLLLGVIQVNGSSVQVGVILAFINYLNIILMALTSSSMVIMQLMRAFPSADRIQQVLETENQVRTIEHPERIAGVKAAIEFKNVSFSYSQNGEQVLKNISFTAWKGEKIGIIGPTGSGKTTLGKLLPRLYEMDQGQILIDGMNIKDIELASLRSSIGYITQKPILFSGSIERNLQFGKTSAVYEELEAASKQACASEFIEKFEDRFDYQLTQGGSNLSGGQKQRLAIARAFVRKPSILVLDDATSALDASSEAMILQTLESDFKGTTTFMISSKISSILDADRILVMDDGEIVSNGTHKELLESCPLYQEIYNTQVKKGGAAVGSANE
ncbi:ABC transporter ATP-binding protein/permease [Domibacillus indicus]|uniref:ABC transporter ATP-binding protein n=1 Tax=Domibacillus indicus TaxID=1437523 RepID=UPI00203EEF5A|nr:ABC transporter ATP-binding protein [Domibacillus indicus]MCM3789235.1 ABC transporter ATP-binding protein/permease [Domibacillus indicus]